MTHRNQNHRQDQNQVGRIGHIILILAYPIFWIFFYRQNGVLCEIEKVNDLPSDILYLLFCAGIAIASFSQRKVIEYDDKHKCYVERKNKLADMCFITYAGYFLIFSTDSVCDWIHDTFYPILIMTLSIIVCLIYLSAAYLNYRIKL